MSFRMQAHAPTARAMIHVVHPKVAEPKEPEHEVDPEQQRAYRAQMAEYEMSRNAFAANAEAIRLGLDAPPAYEEMKGHLYPPGPAEEKEEHKEEHKEETFRLRRRAPPKK